MHVVEIFYPGAVLDFADPELSDELLGMLRRLEQCVIEAAIALSLYQESRANQPPEQTVREGERQREQERDLWNDVDAQIFEEFGDERSRDYQQCRIERDRRILRLKLASGFVPRSYSHMIPFMHAHSFMYAVASFSQFLDALCDDEYEEATPAEVRTIRDAFFPMIRKIRNSAAHVEDRSRGFAGPRQGTKPRKRMEVPFLGLGNLHDHELCYTIADGTYQCVAINLNALTVLGDTTNRVLACFTWKGPPHLSPAQDLQPP